MNEERENPFPSHNGSSAGQDAILRKRKRTPRLKQVQLIDGHWDVNQVAYYLQVSAQSVYRWASQGQLKGMKFGGCLRFPIEDIKAISRTGIKRRRLKSKNEATADERS
ncbi:helix-turn-helix domain-containing protein [bacterium]|nr:helix-turn-helix domain-containing protein [bacterium]